MCFRNRSIPEIWKKSCIIPVPKKPVISCMNDLRPIALTSVPMKVCERLVLNDLKSKVALHLDPMQFAYQKDRNTEDAILTLLELLYAHLERTRFGNSARVMFFDFSSAFNTIQPHLLVKKLLDINVPCGLIRWTLDYLTNRPQYVKIGQSSISNVISSSTGAPQGTVLAPFLFTLYTSDCRSQSSKCPLIKFADDTALIGLISVPGLDLPRKQWTTLNRLRTGVGRFSSSMLKWGLKDSSVCECGAPEQTVDHILDVCPQHRPPSGREGIVSLDEDTRAWLTSTGLEI